jgi:glycosyltransferase involved in cell wall biosynthesis
MVLHMPWDINLGGPQTQMRLAEEFVKLGHEVHKFDYFDAFPYLKWIPLKLSRLVKILSPLFSTQAKYFIQNHANDFDVIDAHHGNLPFSKKELNFQGVLIARSAGLYAFHQNYRKYVENKISIRNENINYLKQILIKYEKKKQESEDKNYIPSLHKADGIIVLNRDEYDYVQNELNMGHKCQSIPNGLTKKQHQSLCECAQKSDIRLQNKKIVFIGNWCPGKGSGDWRQIIIRVREKILNCHFWFLGTGVSEDNVLQDLQLSSCDWLKVIPKYNNRDLPLFLADATIGAFPSYVEGFGIAVLEKLSSGLPTVIYDIPGPRSMVSLIDKSLMIPVGNTALFSQRIIDLLKINEESYQKISDKCIEVANQFSWDIIAKETLELYCDYLGKISYDNKH